MVLLDNLRVKDFFKIDLNPFKRNELYSAALLENLTVVMHAAFNH